MKLFDNFNVKSIKVQLSSGWESSESDEVEAAAV